MNSIFKNSYTEKDYETIRKRIVEIIPELTSEWTDFNESEPGMAYIEIAAGLTDMLCYYLDKQALENYLSTVEQRKNAKSILSLVGYKMDYYRSSVCDVEFTLEYAHAQDIVIPMYTQLSTTRETTNENYFATMEEITIYAGETSKNVNAMEGLVRHIDVPIGQIERERYQLSDLNIAMDSVKIKTNVGEGLELEEVPDIFLHGVGGLYFSSHDDKLGYTWIHFMPDWKEHIILTGDTAVTISYLISTGLKGVATTGSVNKILANIRDTDNAVINFISVTNTENASGGSDPETIKEASYKAPREVQTMWTAVTLRDFIVLAESIPGIRLVNAIDWSDHYGYYTTPSTVEICIVPEVGEYASTFTKNLLLSLLNERKLVALDIVVIDPVYVSFNVTASVIINDYNFSKADIDTLIRAKLNTVYNVSNSVFYEHVRKSKIVSLIHDAHASIRYAELTLPTADIILKSNEIPKINSITLDIIYEDQVE